MSEQLRRQLMLEQSLQGKSMVNSIGNLKNCPFCGKQPTIRTLTNGNTYIQCSSSEPGCAMYATRVEPELWNTRVEEPHVSADDCTPEGCCRKAQGVARKILHELDYSEHIGVMDASMEYACTMALNEILRLLEAPHAPA